MHGQIAGRHIQINTMLGMSLKRIWKPFPGGSSPDPPHVRTPLVPGQSPSTPGGSDHGHPDLAAFGVWMHLRGSPMIEYGLQIDGQCNHLPLRTPGRKRPL